jgi:hypothetical protein
MNKKYGILWSKFIVMKGNIATFLNCIYFLEGNLVQNVTLQLCLFMFL